VGGARRLADEVAERRAARADALTTIDERCEPARTVWNRLVESIYGPELPIEDRGDPVVGWASSWARSMSDDVRGRLEARYRCPVIRFPRDEADERLARYAPSWIGDRIRELHIEPRGSSPVSPV
jgi:hypothetical protein